MNWLRNSWLPVVTMVIILGAALALLLKEHEHGRSGPAVQPGIYPMTERFLPSLEPSVLPVLCSVTETEGLAFREQRDDRLGLEVVPWDEIAIAIEDHHPLTRSVAKAMAEDLTGILARNDTNAATPAAAAAHLVVMLPADTQSPLPLMVRRVLRVRTVAPMGADLAKLAPNTGAQLTVEVGIHDALGPAAIAQVGMMPSGGIRQHCIAVQAEVGASQDRIDWPHWHLTVGRAIARDALLALFDGTGPEVPWDEAADRTQAVLDRHQASNEALAWTSLPGNPPNASVDRWYGSWQGPLVRGWGGAIIGRTVPVTKEGTIVPTIDLLNKVMGKGRWQDPEQDEERWLWRSIKEEGDFEYAIASARAWGWRLSVLGRHDKALEIAVGWLTGAEQGDQRDRAQLRRHLLAQGLPNSWREPAAKLLRTKPDAAEMAVLGRLPDATEAEQAASETIDWIRGLSQDKPMPVPAQALPADWDGRPFLISTANGPAVVSRSAAGLDQAWWRTDEGPRHALGDAAFASAGVAAGP
ncbi:MAG: hypothetical protein PF961_00480 [Planctomycetota bacterium]|jgi:hypothetical protein|nr:hypothetical protein [Planctomycetota bacterium]